MPNHLWDTVSRATATDLITRGARVLVAYSPLEDGTRRVMGYVVFEPGILHWLYVKRDYRGFGVGKALLRAMFNSIEFPGAPDKWIYTHRTKASARFLGRGFEWDPVPARKVMNAER